MRGLIAFLAICSACSPFQERLLSRIPEDFELVPPVAFSTDGREVAYIIKSPEGCWAVRGPWKSRRLDAL